MELTINVLEDISDQDLFVVEHPTPTHKSVPCVPMEERRTLVPTVTIKLEARALEVVILTLRHAHLVALVLLLTHAM